MIGSCRLVVGPEEDLSFDSWEKSRDSKREMDWLEGGEVIEILMLKHSNSLEIFLWTDHLS